MNICANTESLKLYFYLILVEETFPGEILQLTSKYKKLINYSAISHLIANLDLEKYQLKDFFSLDANIFHSL